MTQQRPFQQVDVFTDTPYLGNPLAVVLDGTGLDTDEMQHFAHWTNLSETTFLLPPTPEGAAQGAHYRVRIFTPGSELPFAGHPTLGSCHAWLAAGGKAYSTQTSVNPAPAAGSGVRPTEIIQECALGLVRIRQDGTRLAFAAPPVTRSTPTPELLTQVTAALGLHMQHIQAAQWLDNGPLWLGLLLDSEDAVLTLTPHHAELKGLGLKVGVAHIDKAQPATSLIARSNREARAFGHRASASQTVADNTQVLVRAFAAATGVNEDPVTGSFNASLAQWLIADGLAPASYTATQGTCLGRFGQVYISQDRAGQVWVGGDTVTCIEGCVTL